MANILHIHCINHKMLRKDPYFEKVGYGIWKLCDDKYVIELKSHFCRQSAYNKRIHYTFKDIGFLEELKKSKIFKKIFSVCFVESHYYYEIPDGSNAQYKDFRRFHRINKGIYTLINESDVNIGNDYKINGVDLKDKMKYYVLEI